MIDERKEYVREKEVECMFVYGSSSGLGCLLL